ncbi:hypothetical protein TYRP_006041 [Tyrophagus putrescentiae]|nr:hypothetical protein TYRP_006041 [Tyrophagus putrescentiae]
MFKKVDSQVGHQALLGMCTGRNYSQTSGLSMIAVAVIKAFNSGLGLAARVSRAGPKLQGFSASFNVKV